MTGTTISFLSCLQDKCSHKINPATKGSGGESWTVFAFTNSLVRWKYPSYICISGCVAGLVKPSCIMLSQESTSFGLVCRWWDLLECIYVYRISIKRHCNVCYQVGKWPHPEMRWDHLPGAEPPGSCGSDMEGDVRDPASQMLTNPPSSLQFNSRIWHWQVYFASPCHTHKLRRSCYWEMRGKSPFWVILPYLNELFLMQSRKIVSVPREN